MTQMDPKIDLHLAELNMPLNGRYQVIEILAAKLWARTYLAQDLHRPSQSECVIHHLKAIPIVPNYRAAIRDLIAREATTLEQLGTHPQIPQLLAWFEDEHGFYVVQEFVRGRSLSLDLLPQQVWSPEQVLQLLKSVLEPLAWAHRHGSVHGNLKPENLLRQEDGRFVAIDFSSMQSLQQTLMAAHGLFVPPRTAAQQGYQPLEQLQGLTCAASDVYALGMIAVQALTGTKPIDFQVDPETVQILWQEQLPSSASPLQQQLIPILQNMVQWDLPQRYANAHEVLLALEDVVQVLPAVVEALPVLRPALAGAAIGSSAHRIETMTGSDAGGLGVITVAMPEPVLAIPVVHESDSNLPVRIPTVLPSEQPPEGTGQQPPSDMKGLLATAIASPSVRLGAGGVVVATTFATVGWGLLNSVDWSEKTGKMWERVTTAVEFNGHGNRRTVKTLSDKWRQDWQQAALTFQQAETAMKQGEWAKAKELTTTLPDIPYWRSQGETLLQQMNVKAEVTPSPQLQSAFEYARERNFTDALAELETIQPGTPLDGVVKAKTQEYREKQNIRAWFDLQRAYDRAIARDFTKALAFLYQIPPGTAAYETAQVKIAEYKQKAKIRGQQAPTMSDRTTQPMPVSTISRQSAVVAAVPGSQQVAFHLEVEKQHVNQQATVWLQVADQQAKAGNLTAALTTLEQIPLGTPAYAEARDRILAITAQLHPLTSPTPVVLQAQQKSSVAAATQTDHDRPSLIIGRADLHWVGRPD